MTPREQLFLWLPRGVLAATALLALVLAWKVAGAAAGSPFATLRRRPVLLLGVGLTLAWVAYEELLWAGLTSETWLRSTRPLLAPLVLGAVLYACARLTRVSARMPAARKHLGDVAALAALLALGLAAAGLELGRPIDRLTVILVLDRSRSIDLVPGGEERVARERAVAEGGMTGSDRIGVVAFGAEAATEEAPRTREIVSTSQRAVLGRDGTDLAAAMRRALAEVPSDSAARIVLVSDGVATRGDTMSAAAAALAAGIPVDVLPLEQKPLANVRVAALRAPIRADEGEVFELRLVTSSPAATKLQVRVKRDGELVAKADADIAAGEDVLRIKETAPSPGLHRFDVEITAADASIDQAPEDNSGTAFLRVRGPSSALVLDGDKESAFVADALRGAAFRVKQGATGDAPQDIGELAAFDLVVLSDVRAMDLSESQLDALGSYVRDLGGGLVLLGGDRSMGPGGYARTAVEEVSPVSFDLKQEQRRATLAEVIGIDISGSMAARAGGRTKLELANEGAARSASLLGSGDSLGVAHVDTVVKWSVPLAPVKDKPAIEAAIRGVGPGGGGIIVDITLDAGYEALRKYPGAMVKHLLLFADGSDAEQMTGCRAKVSAALRDGITTSVVALGNGSDVPELEVLSKLGNGRFYLVEDASKLPAVFSQETILAAKSSISEKPFRVSVGQPSPALVGVDWKQAPELAGYVITIAKPRSTVALVGPDGDPILAHWSVGVGKSAAFTSDLKSRWGRSWTSWPGATRMVAQLGREVARKSDDARVRLESDAAGGELHVRASVVGDDGRAQSFRRLVALVAGPDGFRREVPLEATGAGAYATAVPLSRPGTYVAGVKDEVSGELVGTTGTALTTGEELRPTGSDVALLTRIAELTGGKRRDTLAGIFRDRGARRFAYEDKGRALALAGAILLVFLVAARRLSPPDWLLALARRKRRPAPAVVATHAAVDAMSRAKERGALPAEAAPAQHRQVRSPETQVPTRKDWAPPPVATQQPRGPARADPPAGADAPVSQRAPASQRGPGSQRPLTAAEILLAKRRQKRG